jgi:DMSO/TMAO reductase YedYZ molybdopterin-dependent catalytic subunit
LLTGAVGTIVYYVGTEFLGLPYPPEAIFQLLINPVPGSVQSVAVENLRQYAKYGALTFASVIFAVLYGAIGVLMGLLSERKFSRMMVIGVGTTVATIIALGMESVFASSVSILSSIFGWATVGALAIVISFGFSYYFVSSLHAPLPAAVQAGAGLSPERRRLLKRVGFGALALVAVYIAARLGLSLFSRQPVIQSNTAVPVNPPTVEVSSTTAPLAPIFNDPRIADLVQSEVTDNRVFYRVDIDPFPPSIDFNQWMLNVTGRVDKELTIAKSDLLAMPSSDEYATLECVSNTINPPGALISNGKWTGVPLATILNQAGLTPDAIYVIFHCADGYTVGIPKERAMEPGALLAYMMNDLLLPMEHGSPLRAIVPGLYGMMNAKWITGIEASNNVYLGYWQERGWTNDARIKTTSIIYYPQPGNQVNGVTPIAGVAFAGDRGISKVEVSTDGGTTWNTAELKPPKSSYSWVLWAYHWTPASPGTYTIVVRATDGTGQVQDVTSTQPFPNGATGYNSTTVNVT